MDGFPTNPTPLPRLQTPPDSPRPQPSPAPLQLDHFGGVLSHPLHDSMGPRGAPEAVELCGWAMEELDWRAGVLGVGEGERLGGFGGLVLGVASIW